MTNFEELTPEELNQLLALVPVDESMEKFENTLREHIPQCEEAFQSEGYEISLQLIELGIIDNPHLAVPAQNQLVRLQNENASPLVLVIPIDDKFPLETNRFSELFSKPFGKFTVISQDTLQDHSTVEWHLIGDTSKWIEAKFEAEYNSNYVSFRIMWPYLPTSSPINQSKGESHMSEQPPQNNEPSIQRAQFSSFDQVKPSGENKTNLDMLLDIPLNVTVELGRTRKTVKEILEISQGSIIELDKLAGEPVDILVNQKLIAVGEVVVIDEQFGIRVTDISSQADRLAKLR